MLVVITHAGGGNVTGTARGLIKAGATDTKIIGASVDFQDFIWHLISILIRNPLQQAIQDLEFHL